MALRFSLLIAVEQQGISESKYNKKISLRFGVKY